MDIIAQIEEKASRNYFYLTNDHFKHGTLLFDQDYTTIILQEDIIFDPNPDFDYRPKPDHEQYSGREFDMGFFTIIAIYSKYVVLDLNGYTLKYSDIMSLEQIWGSCIELANSAFINKEGPGVFIDNDKYKAAEYIVIKNGTIGFNPHHCIRSPGKNKHIYIHDLKMVDFEIACIQFGGIDNLYINNVQLGPQKRNIPFNGKFGAFRFLINKYRQTIYYMYNLLEQGGDNTFEYKEIHDDIEYLQSCYSLLIEINSVILDHYKETGNIITQDLENEFDGVHNSNCYFISIGKEGFQVRDFVKSQCPYSISIPKQYENSTRSQTNENGIYIDKSQYTSESSNILSKSLNNFPLGKCSRNITMKNINMHGLDCITDEVTGIKPKGSIIPDDVIVDFSGSVYNYDDLLKYNSYEFQSNLLWYQVQLSIIMQKYDINLGVSNLKGDILELFINMFPFNYPELPNSINEKIIITPFTPEQLYDIGYEFTCSIDNQNHKIKGIMPIRIDATVDFYLENISVSDINNISRLGDDITNSNYRYLYNDQTMIGYAGCETRAITLSSCRNGKLNNIQFSNLYSQNGCSYGIKIFNGCYNISLSNIIGNNIRCGHIYIDEKWYGISKEGEIVPYSSDYPNKTPLIAFIYVEDSCLIRFNNTVCSQLLPCPGEAFTYLIK